MEKEEDWDYSKIDEGRHLKYNVHSLLQSIPNEKVQRIAKMTSVPFGILMLNLDKNMNIGITIRTAAAMGCSDLYIVGRKKYDARSVVGAKNYINIHKLSTIDPETFFKENNLLPIVIEQGGVPLEKFSFKSMIRSVSTGGPKPVIILGTEGTGVPKEWMKIGQCISITQLGVIRSLNVSVCASMLIYEYTKQWKEVMDGLI
jgi:tRNA G18 (ribose-2'-O)-methylase SpoU